MPSSKKASFVVPIFLWIALMGLTIAGDLLAVAANKAKALGENHALIIGINDYKQWPKLKSPANDAEAISKILSEKFNFKRSNITLLTDKTGTPPTLINILAAFDRYANTLTEKDNLLIFFSGQSTEDDQGETYWIPIDGNQTTQLTWLKHADMIEAYFASDKLKAKNLCIITDSMFSRKLLQRYTVPVTMDNLRYEEKILERAARRSREVIAFGEEHWPGNESTNGMGLFAYYIHKALSDSEFDLLDFENLLFDENILFPISKIAGARLINGRIRSGMEEKGQFVIARTEELPLVNVAESGVIPDRGYPGDAFTFTVKTDKPAFQVYLEADGKKQPMKGQGNSWTLAAVFDKEGRMPFRVFATNENDIAGSEQKGEINIIKKRAEAANVAAATVSPQQGKQGDAFRFTATTDRPATEVVVRINGKPYKMTGSGTSWSLTQTVEEIGSVGYAVAAINQDGVQGTAKSGNIAIQAAPVSIVALKTAPESGYAGEEFTISVNTDRPAKSVSLSMDGKDYAMEGSGTAWRFKKIIDEIGTQSFSIAALNVEGMAGAAKSGQIITKKSPLPIPDVASAAVSIVSPGKGYVGDRWSIKANTTAPADKVFVEIEGKRFPMQGTGREWNYVAKIDNVGANPYRVIAINKDGAQGKTAEGVITARKPAALPVNIVKASVTPEKGHVAKPFTFDVTTDRPANEVVMIIGKTRYKLNGKDTQWQLVQDVKDTGDLTFAVAALNEDGRPGRPQKGAFTVFQERFRVNADGTVTDLINGKKTPRFVNNGDGTVTDLLTSLMWLQTPKQIAVTYNEAVEYCRTLSVGDLKGWRLPTIGELDKLADKNRQNPALPAGHPFENVVTHVGYWSKTRHKFGPQYVYQMSMWYGKSNHQKKDANAIVWPVRYAQLPEG